MFLINQTVQQIALETGSDTAELMAIWRNIIEGFKAQQDSEGMDWESYIDEVASYEYSLPYEFKEFLIDSEPALEEVAA